MWTSVGLMQRRWRSWAVDPLNKLSLWNEKIWTGCRVYWCLLILCCCSCYFAVKHITAVPRNHSRELQLALATRTGHKAELLFQGRLSWMKVICSRWAGGKKNNRFAVLLWVSFVSRSWWHFQDQIGKVKSESSLRFSVSTDTGFKPLSDFELRFWKCFRGNTFFKDHCLPLEIIFCKRNLL